MQSGDFAKRLFFVKYLWINKLKNNLQKGLKI